MMEPIEHTLVPTFASMALGALTAGLGMILPLPFPLRVGPFLVLPFVLGMRAFLG